MLLANAKMLWRKVAGKSVDRIRNDPCINWLSGLICMVWQDITNSHMCFITVYIHLCCSGVNKKVQKV